MSVTTLEQILPWNNSVEGRQSQALHTVSSLGARISLWTGDLTKLKVDAIANAANSRLAGGGGLDGVIHRAAGPGLPEACQALGGCLTGSAKITVGFALPAKHIIHCVGPRGEKPDLLRSTYHRALELCSENNLRSVAFPCISTGIFGYPQEPAASVAIQTVIDYLSEHSEIDRVIFCTFLKEDYQIYKQLLPKLLAASISNQS